MPQVVGQLYFVGEEGAVSVEGSQLVVEASFYRATLGSYEVVHLFN